jgi:hypothetical protein
MGSKFFETTDDGEFVFRFHRPRMFDDETRSHLMDAQKHALQAARSMVDAMLSAMEKRDEGEPVGRRQNIDID